MKKRTPSLLLALLALAGLLTAGGCSLGRSPRPDFYMLYPPQRAGLSHAFAAAFPVAHCRGYRPL